MSKVNVAGDAIVVTSDLTLEDIKLVEKYRAKELTLMGGEDNKEPIFKMSTCNDAGSIGEYGVCFGRCNEDGEAQLTMITSGFDGKKPEEYVADAIGGALANLNALEEKLPEVIDDIREKRKAIMDSVSVAC